MAAFNCFAPRKTSSGSTRPTVNSVSLKSTKHLPWMRSNSCSPSKKNWVPSQPGTSLYIRPTIIATDPFLGVRASHTYRFFIILCPVGAYYAEGFNPVKIMVTKEHVRAVRGGVGDTKTMGNYAASLLAGEKAHDEGYTQVLWLDGVELKYIEEVGSMNIFFVIDDELITPMLSGSILPGITRDSVIQLGRSWGLTVTERKISIDEVMEAHESGRLKEIFGSGTAAVISPVGELKYDEKVITVGWWSGGPLGPPFFSRPSRTFSMASLKAHQVGWKKSKSRLSDKKLPLCKGWTKTREVE